MTRIDFYCLLLAAIGVASIYWGKRRSFMRTNACGVELHSGFARMVMAKTVDALLVAAGVGFIAASALILALEYAGNWVGVAAVLLVFFYLEREWYERRR